MADALIRIFCITRKPGDAQEKSLDSAPRGADHLTTQTQYGFQGGVK